MAFTGSCHCGKLKYRVDEDKPTKAMACNCSRCRRTGALHHFTAPDKFQREADEGDIQTFEWNRKVITYEFCKTCGCAPFAHGTGPNGPMVEINLRCADDIDVDALEISRFDGAHKL